MKSYLLCKKKIILIIIYFRKIAFQQTRFRKILENYYYARRGCGVVVSTSEHHAGGMGSNPTPRK
jgi:hypothetical protein